MIKEEILELLRHTEQGVIFSFIARYAAEDKRFYEKIKEALLPDDEEEKCDIEYYKNIAEDCFDFVDLSERYRGYAYDFHEAAYRAASGLNKMLDDAAFLTQQGKYANAAAMAIAVAEVIPQHAEDIDDSDGELSDTFSKAVTLLCDIVNNPAASVSVKKEIIYDRSKEEVRKSVYSDYGFDDFRTLYELCCEQLGDTDEVLADIDGEIREATREYHRDKAVLWKIRFMRSRNLDTENIIRSHLDIDEVRKILFNQLKDAEKYDEALQIAVQGIEIAKQRNYRGTEIDWQKSVFDIYLLQGGDTENLLPKAEYLFHHAGGRYSKEEFYNVLKKYTPAAEWPDTLERLLAPAEEGRGFDSFAARIMCEHQMWQRLFTYCGKGNITNLEQYETALKPHFEKEILEHYRDYVEKQAQITDWRAYDEVARILKRMRTFTDGNALTDQLLEKYRATYKRRKNMMEALKEV